MMKAAAGIRIPLAAVRTPIMSSTAADADITMSTAVDAPTTTAKKMNPSRSSQA